MNFNTSDLSKMNTDQINLFINELAHCIETNKSVHISDSDYRVNLISEKSFDQLNAEQKDELLQKMYGLLEKVERQNGQTYRFRVVLDFFRKLSPSQVKDSVPSVTASSSKLQTKTGAMWEVTERKPNSNGGFIYILKLKDRYSDNQNFAEKVAEIFPAVEPNKWMGTCLQHDEISEHSTQEKLEGAEMSFKKNMQKVAPTLLKLGYYSEDREDGMLIELPDHLALTENYKHLCRENPELPSLDIAPSNGVADDLSFIQAFLDHDVLLSSGQEFMHDHFYHIIPTIARALEGKDSYKEEQQRLRNLIGDFLLGLKLLSNHLNEDQSHSLITKRNLEQMASCLGSFVDTISAHFSVKETSIFDKDKFIEECVLGLSMQGDWRWFLHFEKRYGRGNLLFVESAKQLIKEILRVADEYKQRESKELSQ